MSALHILKSNITKFKVSYKVGLCVLIFLISDVIVPFVFARVPRFCQCFASDCFLAHQSDTSSHSLLFQSHIFQLSISFFLSQRQHQ